MAEDTTSTKRDSAKIEKGEREVIEKALKFIRNAGLVGTITVGGMIAGAVKWLDDRISTTVSEAVRKEVDPLKERLMRLELKAEIRAEDKANGK
jgi:hypothetical protein